MSNLDSMWFCGPCKGKVEKNIVIALKIEERCNAIIREFEDRLSSLENEIFSKCNESDVQRIVREEINNNKTDINSATAAFDNQPKTEPKTTVTSVITEINERKNSV